MPSWNDGPAKRAIIQFVHATTDASNRLFVQPAARIATFDQDGTHTELTYLPMLEVMRYLRTNGYKTYIVTGGGVRNPAADAASLKKVHVPGQVPG